MFVFDLDHTVIDSSHRQCTLSDGSLDLNHWRENSTAEMIAKDTLLPLSYAWKELKKRGETLAVCTARVMSEYDIAFLQRHGLHYDHLLSRKEGDNSPDHLLKERLLTEKFGEDFPYQITAFFDDNQKVIKHMRKLGVLMYDAIKLNRT